MTAQKQKRWIVRDSQGRIYGPFPTEKVLEQIERNYFLGGEFVAVYPGGDWVPISRTPEFSDRLLDVLANEVSERAVGQASPASAPDTGTKSASAKTEPPITNPSMLQDGVSVTAPRPQTQTKSSQVIELTDLKAFQRLQQLKESRLPLIIIVATLLIGGLGFLMSSNGPLGEDRIRLTGLRKAGSPMSDSRLKEKFGRALSSFQTDTFAGYRRAENELVEIVEGASQAPGASLKKAEYLSFLCLTYRELWPFAYQDMKDMKAITTAMQEAKRLDPGGLHGSICEIVQLMLNGRARDAQGLVEAVLLEKSQAPVLFEIRGELFFLSNDMMNAANYFGQGRALWPGWQKPAVYEARARAEMKQYSEAIQLLRETLSKVSDHGIAKIELGITEALKFNQYDKGLELISAGVGETIPRTFAARGHLGLAQIYMKKQQKGRARDAAKKAFNLDPTSKEAKELVVSLGGDGRPQQGEVDLMFLGEQYLRAGDYYSAQAQFKAAFEANEKNGIAAMKAGKCLWQLNQTADAIEWMRRAIRADPQLLAAYVELADYYAQRFDFLSAIEVLRKAQVVQPKSFEVYRGFALVELRRNNFKGALGYGQSALKLYATDIETLLLMAKAHIGLQQFPEAQKLAARAIDLDYNNTEAHSLSAKIEAGLHGVDSGAAYIQQMLNRYVITQGRQVPQAAIDLRITLGEIFMQDERFKQAEDLFRQALALEANSKKALVSLGKAHQAQSQGAQALEAFLKAAVLDPSDAEPIYLSGQLYLDSGKLLDSQKQFERVLKINPRYPKAHVALGRVALRRGDAKKALEETLQEKTLNPELPDSFVLAAEAYSSMRQFANCAREYQQAATRRKQGATLLVRMARCYRLSGSLDSAQSLLRQATSIESGNPDIYKEQGAIFHTKGMADEALSAYDTYLRLAPNAPDRNEVEQRVRRVQSGDMTFSD